MTFAQALAQTWMRALVFGVFFMLLTLGLDLLWSRSATWEGRIISVAIGVLVYWVLTAAMLRRRRGEG